jgi:hypothetical protein
MWTISLASPKGSADFHFQTTSNVECVIEFGLDANNNPVLEVIDHSQQIVRPLGSLVCFCSAGTALQVFFRLRCDRIHWNLRLRYESVCATYQTQNILPYFRQHVGDEWQQLPVMTLKRTEQGSQFLLPQVSTGAQKLSEAERVCTITWQEKEMDNLSRCLKKLGDATDCECKQSLRMAVNLSEKCGVPQDHSSMLRAQRILTEIALAEALATGDTWLARLICSSEEAKNVLEPKTLRAVRRRLDALADISPETSLKLKTALNVGQTQAHERLSQLLSVVFAKHCTPDCLSALLRRVDIKNSRVFPDRGFGDGSHSGPVPDRFPVWKPSTLNPKP